MAEKKAKETAVKEIKKEAAMPAKIDAKAEKPTAKEKVESKADTGKGGLVKQALDTAKKLREKPEEKKERKIKFERVYNVPIRQLVSRPRRTRVAVRNLRDFVAKHTKAKEIKIDEALNRHIWERGYKKPPIRVRVSVSVDDEGLAVVNLKK